eukprot:150217-Pyramimonas_sp.AAC.1
MPQYFLLQKRRRVAHRHRPSPPSSMPVCNSSTLLEKEVLRHKVHRPRREERRTRPTTDMMSCPPQTKTHLNDFNCLKPCCAGSEMGGCGCEARGQQAPSGRSPPTGFAMALVGRPEEGVKSPPLGGRVPSDLRLAMGPQNEIVKDGKPRRLAGYMCGPVRKGLLGIGLYLTDSGCSLS